MPNGSSERATGLGRPSPAALMPRPRKTHAFRFSDDGQTPNNSHFPLILYRSPVRLICGIDPAALFEDLFAAHGWRRSWRDGLYDHLHFHTASHEVLGIARGRASARFGGRKGRILNLRAGDVVILPAGTGHMRVSKSPDLLVVGAYPAGGRYDEPGPADIAHEKAVRRIARVGIPAQDPVYGKRGPLRRLWKA